MYSLLIILFIMLSLFLSMQFSVRKGAKIIFMLVVVLFAFFMAFRSVMIPDTQNYIQIYERLDVNKDYGFSILRENGTFGIEYGFLWLLLIVKKFFEVNYTAIFFLIAVFNTSVSVWAIFKILTYIDINSRLNNLKEKWVFLACIYLSYFGLYYSGIAIRSGIAMSLILLAVAAAMHNNYIGVIILCIMAFTLHKLSIMGIALIFIIKYMPKMRKEIFIGIWGIVGILQFIFQLPWLKQMMNKLLNQISEKYSFLDYSRYLSNIENSSSSYVFAIWIIGFALIVLSYNKGNLYKLFNVYLVGFISILCLSWVQGYSRLTDYFMIVNVPLIYKTYMMKGKWKITTSSVVILSVGINLYKVLTIYGLL